MDKIKILKVGPVGDIIMEETFHLSFVKPRKIEIINGILHEPMIQHRYLLEIGDFVYIINNNTGELEELVHLRKEKNFDK